MTNCSQPRPRSVGADAIPQIAFCRYFAEPAA